MSRAIEILNDDDMDWVRDEDHGFGGVHTERGHLPLTQMDVQAKLSGIFVRTIVEQTFVNHFETPLEATYIFPLPDRAAVTALRIEVAGRTVVGELKERAQARRAYANAIETGHRAAIAEEERPGVFTMRAGNIMPGEQTRVRIELVGQIETRGDEATFRFPLVVAPRYVPGRPLGDNVGSGVANDTDQVPDASRISPPVLLEGYPNPVRLSLSVDLDPAGLPIRNVRSSLHAVMVDEDSFGDGTVERIRLVPGERLNRDFILRFALGQNAVGTGLRVWPDSSQTEGTFALTIVPPRRDTITRQPRDIVFVLDRSGSMQGWKMVAARRAVARMVDSLDYDDHFSVLTFDNHIETTPGFAKQLVRATDRNRHKTVKYLQKVDARGGTMMLTPLRTATQMLRTSTANERIIVLVTDGQVGNEGQIVSLFQQAPHCPRIFTIGIDRAVNAAFLKRLADLGGGGSELVEDEDRLDAVMSSIHRRIDTPLWKGLSLAAKGFKIDPDSIAPAKMPDVFPGNPVVIMGRYQGDAAGASIEVRAKEQDGASLSRTVQANRGGEHLISKVWARARIRDLEDRFEATGSRTGAETITELSLRFGVMCRFTSFVAVDDAEVVNPGGEQHQVTQAVETPEGWGSGKMKRRRRKAFAMPQAQMPAADFDAPRAPAPMSSAAPAGGSAGVDSYGSSPLQMPPAERGSSAQRSLRIASATPKAVSVPLDELSFDDDFDDEGFEDAFDAAEDDSVDAQAPSLESAYNEGFERNAPSKRLQRQGSRTRRKTTRSDVVQMWTTLTSPPTKTDAEHLLRLGQLMSLLDEALKIGFADDLAAAEVSALRDLATRVRALLGRGTRCESVDIADLLGDAERILEAVKTSSTLPVELTTSRPVGRGEDFWR